MAGKSRSAELLQLRRYRDADSEAVWSLHDRALHDAGAHAGDGPWDDDLRSISAVYLNDGEFLVGELDGAIVAMGALRRSAPDRAEVKRMRVDPAYQRRGFGELILGRLEARARELGVRTLFLDTTVVQTGAEQLYRKHGFIETGRGEAAGLEVILFEKHLSG